MGSMGDVKQKKKNIDYQKNVELEAFICKLF